MSTKPITRSRRYWWWLALLLLLVLPFLPELVIYAVAALAKAGGCLVNEDWVCLIAGVRVADIIAKMLRSGISVARHTGAIVWLGFCYLAITFGWRRLASRLSLGLIVTIFAVALYFGPEKSISDLHSNNCPLTEGGAVQGSVAQGGDVQGGDVQGSLVQDAVVQGGGVHCMIFGVDIAPSVKGIVNTNLTYLVFVIAAGAFVFYVIVAIVIWACGATYRITRRRNGLTDHAQRT